MGIKSKKRSGVAAALTAAAVAGLSMFGVASAQATPPQSGPPTCSADDLNASIIELPAPNDQERLYELNFQAKPGVTCQLNGTPEHLIFYGPSGALPIDAEMPAPGTAEPVTVSEQKSAAAYLAGPKTDGPARATSVSFNLPSDDTAIRTAWVSGGVDGPLRLGNFTAPVS